MSGPERNFSISAFVITGILAVLHRLPLADDVPSKHSLPACSPEDVQSFSPKTQLHSVAYVMRVSGALLNLEDCISNLDVDDRMRTQRLDHVDHPLGKDAPGFCGRCEVLWPDSKTDFRGSRLAPKCRACELRQLQGQVIRSERYLVSVQLQLTLD